MVVAEARVIGVGSCKQGEGGKGGKERGRGRGGESAWHIVQVLLVLSSPFVVSMANPGGR